MLNNNTGSLETWIAPGYSDKVFLRAVTNQPDWSIHEKLIQQKLVNFRSRAISFFIHLHDICGKKDHIIARIMY